MSQSDGRIIELVIFDCDGVLIDSEVVAAKAEMSIYKKHGVEMETEEFASRFAGSSSDEILKVLENEAGQSFPDGILREITDEVDERCAKDAGIISFADKVLDQFDQARCICSNSPQHRLKAMLTRTGLYDRFRPYIFSAKDFDPPANKPKPDVFNLALEKFNVSADRAIVVEDSAHGIAGAIAAGTRVVGFTGGSHSYSGHADILIDAGAETVIRRMEDLPAIIDAYGQWSST